jgi:hypothetical protein
MNLKKMCLVLVLVLVVVGIVFAQSTGDKGVTLVVGKIDGATVIMLSNANDKDVSVTYKFTAENSRTGEKVDCNGQNVVRANTRGNATYKGPGLTKGGYKNGLWSSWIVFSNLEIIKVNYM